MIKNTPNHLRKKNTYLRPCRKCDELFKPASKYTYLCDDCKKIVSKERASNSKKANKKIAKSKELGKIKTKVACPKCGETIDFGHVKQAVTERISQELETLIKKI
jgi:ribosomal protein L32